jgi:hypothetical protein
MRDSGGTSACRSTIEQWIQQIDYTCSVMTFFEQILYYKQRYRLLSHLFFWLAALLISVSVSKYRDGHEFTYQFAFISNSLYMAPQILAAYFLTYWMVPQFFFKKKYVFTLAGFLLGSYLICTLARFLVIKIAEPLAGIARNPLETNREILTDLSKLFYNYFFSIFSLAFVFVFIKLLKDQLDVQKRALTLEKQKAEAELKLLKTQLNPHFLFNTLNNIYSLSLMSSPATSPAIARLAEILDHILYRCNAEFVPLASEISLLNNYIALEKLRYDEGLKVDFTTQIDHDIRIAPLIMLTLVENAFKHGAGKDSGDPFINISIEVTEKVFTFSVENSKRPGLNKDTGQLGLPNLRQQLQLIYERNQSLEIYQTENLFAVTLQIRL